MTQTRKTRATRLLLPLLPLLVCGLGAAGPAKVDPGEAPYVALNTAAMNRMMADMSNPPSGDVDQDFVAAMVPHHQGAIDMAKAELRYGHNEKLRRMAQEIVVEQSREITAMHLALHEDAHGGTGK